MSPLGMVETPCLAGEGQGGEAVAVDEPESFAYSSFNSIEPGAKM